MASKKRGKQHTKGKACAICGKRAAARVNGQAWLCATHTRELAALSLMAGIPVLQAVRGEPQSLIMPTAGISKN